MMRMTLPVVPEKPPPPRLPVLVRMRQALIALTPAQLKEIKLAHWLWAGAGLLLAVFFAWRES